MAISKITRLFMFCFSLVVRFRQVKRIFSVQKSRGPFRQRHQPFVLRAATFPVRCATGKEGASRTKNPSSVILEEEKAHQQTGAGTASLL
jgi:hypothetical protein